MKLPLRFLLIYLIIGLVISSLAISFYLAILQHERAFPGFHTTLLVHLIATVVIALGGTVAAGVLAARFLGQRGKAEAEARESEARYRSLFEHNPNAIYALDPRGNITSVNETACRLTGYTRAELLAMNAASLIPPVTIESERRYLRLTLEGKPQTYESTIVTRDGRTALLDVTLSPIIVEGNAVGAYGVARDITEEMRTERALAESELNFRASLNELPLGVRIIDAAGRDLYINQTMMDILGLGSVDDLEETPVTSFYAPASYTELLERREKRLRGEGTPENFQVDIVRRDGSPRRLEVFQRQVLWNRQKQFQLLYNDITEGWQAEEALRVSEGNFRNSLDSSPLGVRIVSEDGETLYGNRAILDIYGYESIDELKATTTRDRYTPESYAEMQVRREKRRRGEPVPDSYEISIVRKGGEIRHLQVFRKEVLWGGKRQFQTLYRDITARKRAEEALLASEERYRDLYENAPVMYFSVGIDGKIQMANRRVSEVLGYSNEELTGRAVLELYAPTASGRERASALFARFAAGESFNGEEMEMQAKDRRQVWVSFSVRPVMDAAGRIIASRSVARDITERKKAEEALRRERNRAQMYLDIAGVMMVAIDAAGTVTMINQRGCEILGYEAGEIVGRNWFTSFIPERMRGEILDVSHELRTPLSAIKGFTSTLLRTDTRWSKAQQREYLQIIDEETDRLTRLIDDLLDMSRIEAGMLTINRVRHRITEVIDAIKPRLATLAERHQLELTVPPSLPAVNVDVMRLGQVISNLVDNAIKHSPAGSAITIIARQEGESIVVSVIDRGEGIPASFMDKLFDRFTQTEGVVTGRSKGTGLALPISKGIIEAHGGTIWAESEPGRGATFSFRLPASKEGTDG